MHLIFIPRFFRSWPFPGVSTEVTSKIWGINPGHGWKKLIESLVMFFEFPGTWVVLGSHFFGSCILLGFFVCVCVFFAGIFQGLHSPNLSRLGNFTDVFRGYKMPLGIRWWYFPASYVSLWPRDKTLLGGGFMLYNCSFSPRDLWKNPIVTNTPPKTNMSPINWSFQKEISLPTTNFSGDMLVFGEVFFPLGCSTTT